jgi:hypothetical protein
MDLRYLPDLSDMTRTRDEIQECRRRLKAEYGKLFDSMRGTETNFTAKRCDVDSLGHLQTGSSLKNKG